MIRHDFDKPTDLPKSSSLTTLLERIAFYGMLAVILLSSIPRGTIDAWSVHSLIFAICFFGAIRVLESLLKGDFAFSQPILFLPLLGILALAIIQIIPLGRLADPITKTISLDPIETRNFILRFISCLICGEVLLHYATTRKRLMALFLLVVIAGTASALFGLIRLALSNDVLLTDSTAQFAQFANRNHFAFLMEMTVGVLVGFQLVYKPAKKFRPLLWTVTALAVVATIVSQSRGGLFSLLAIGIMAIAFFVYSLPSKTGDSRRGARSGTYGTGLSRPMKAVLSVLFVLIFLGVSVFMVAFIGGDPVVTRIERLPGEIQEQSDNKVRRMDIWKSTVELIETRPVLGVGFGAYPVVITRFDQSSGKFNLQQAHNEYLDLIANGGIIAFILMLLFLILVFRRAKEEYKLSDSLRKALCFGAGLGIVGVLLHNTADFGLRPAVNALIFIVLIVMCVARIDNEKVDG